MALDFKKPAGQTQIPVVAAAPPQQEIEVVQ